jgi:hypothetical protein
MKVALVLMSVVLLILLTRPSEAKEVYFAVVSEDMLKGAATLDDLDPLVKVDEPEYKIDHHFQKGDLTLPGDQELIIRGGRASIARELERYKSKRIILGSTRTSQSLAAYGCYHKRPIGKDNTTYVMVRAKPWYGEKQCEKELKTNAAGITKAILLGTLSAEVKAIPEK